MAWSHRTSSSASDKLYSPFSTALSLLSTRPWESEEDIFSVAHDRA